MIDISGGDALIRLIHSIVDMRVDARLRALGHQVEGGDYSSTDLPPRTSRRAFVRRCASGRVRDAHRELRIWICSKAAWHDSLLQVAPVAAPTSSARYLEVLEATRAANGLRRI